MSKIFIFLLAFSAAGTAIVLSMTTFSPPSVVESQPDGLISTADAPPLYLKEGATVCTSEGWNARCWQAGGILAEVVQKKGSQVRVNAGGLLGWVSAHNLTHTPPKIDTQ